MLIFTNSCPNWWKIGEAERRFIFHSHKTGCIRNHSILWDTRSNPVWRQIVSLFYSCVIQKISIVLKAKKFSQITMRSNKQKILTKDARVQLYLLCELFKKRIHLQNKRSVAYDVMTKLKHFILITVPHINVVMGRGQLKQSQHQLTMSWCRGTQREYSSKLLIALLNVF